ncbi:MAG: 50S ribosomal protein L23 [Candidatus Staskawiczbacteria bacterium]|nr:50S ribosomal protein L23 [Candidatus Staskawiczbacteria bacterium]
MALLDFLKNKKQAEKAKKPASAKSYGEAKPAKKAEKVSNVKKPAQKAKPIEAGPQQSRQKASLGRFSYEAIKQPHISEKASYLAEKDQYIFDVLPNYNKNEIKNSVEGIYGVDVLSVNIIKIPAKKRRLGRTEGFRKAYKKAIVKIKNGQKIEIL